MISSFFVIHVGENKIKWILTAGGGKRKGATASVRGSAHFSAFATAKFGLRALTQSLAREFGPKGVHISHVIVDGVIDIPRTKDWKFEHEDAKLSPDAVSSSWVSLVASLKV